MKLSILLRTSAFRGDHSADIAVAYDILPGETVEALTRRIFEQRPKDRWGDCIEIRVVAGPEEEP